MMRSSYGFLFGQLAGRVAISNARGDQSNPPKAASELEQKGLQGPNDLARHDTLTPT
jgi:hypothetical protein